MLAKYEHRVGFVLLAIGVSIVAASALWDSGANAASQDDISILMGTSGRVTTMECYDPEPTRDHPVHSGKPDPFAPCTSTDYDSDGVNGSHAATLDHTIDLGASSGSDVWVQNDYLSSAVRGGYLYATNISSYCADQTGSGYNGKKTRVTLYYYDGVGYADAHYVLYQHIDQAAGSLDDWKHWNNTFATNPLWDAFVEDFTMNDLYNDGFQVGDIANFGASPPAGCATGEHLHQEIDGGHASGYATNKWADGCYDPPGTGSGCPGMGTFDWVAGVSVTARFSDAHDLTIDLN